MTPSLFEKVNDDEQPLYSAFERRKYKKILNENFLILLRFSRCCLSVSPIENQLGAHFLTSAPLIESVIKAQSVIDKKVREYVSILFA